MRGFLRNLYLRPSCHACPSKAFTSGSDLTLGDYWGIHQIHTNFDDDKGCSLVLCNTLKGKQVYDKVMHKTSSIETTLDNALVGNPCIIRSVTPHRNRAIFFEKMGAQSITELILFQSKPSYREIIKQLIYDILHKTKVIAVYKRYKR